MDQAADIGRSVVGVGAVDVGALDAQAWRLPAGRRWRLACLIAVVLAAMLAALIAALTLNGGGGAASPSLPAPQGEGLTMLPAAAQGPISAALGAREPTFLVHGGGGELTTVNAGAGLHARFGRDGGSVRGGDGYLGLTLAAIGRGDSLTRVPSVSPRAAANRVSYAYPGVKEWFANGPLGLEQGFTVARTPAGSANGPLTLALGLRLSSGLRASLRDQDRTLTLSRSGRTVLFYRGLEVSDAHGRALHARLVLQGNRLLIEVDDRHATYPIRIDPWIQAAELTPSMPSGGGYLGYSVAISANGETIAAGAPGAYVNGTESQGAVAVFTEPAGGWASMSQPAYLQGSNATSSNGLGYSVAISANGETIAAGAPGAYVNGTGNQGAVAVFTEPAGGWASTSQPAYLEASNGSADNDLGYSVAISADGETIVAGAPFHGTGAAYVFTEPGGGWSTETEAAELDASGASDGDLGYSVAISDSTVVAGAPNAEVDGTDTGAAYAFQEPAGGWADATQTAELTASNASASAEIGSAVAISGQTIVAGAPLQTKPVLGAAYVFEEPAGGWADEGQTAELTASDGSTAAAIGESVAISANGQTVATGVPSTGALSSIGPGLVFVFDEPAGGWADETQAAAELSASDGTVSSQFGLSVAATNTEIVAGAPFHSSPDGTAYVFGLVDATSTDVSCSPVTVDTGQAVSCTATVTDTGGSSPPSLDVNWGSSAPSGSFTGGLCLSGSGASISCFVTYAQSAAGSAAVTASYPGGSGFAASSGSTGVTVAADSTQTTLSCSPTDPAPGNSSTCTATVTDTSSSPTTPTGQIDLSALGATGSFSDSGQCTLSSGSCTLNFKLSNTASGETTITASYQGDSTHAASSSETVLNGGYQSFLEGPSCGIDGADSDQVGQPITCVVWILGTPPATIGPEGNLTWSSSTTGSFSTPPNPTSGDLTGNPCTLYNNYPNIDIEYCEEQFTPSTAGSDTITVSYPGDTEYSPEQTSVTLTVDPDPTQTTVACTPNPTSAGQQTRCTSTITDTSADPITPTGSVDFTSTSPGSFTGSGSCSLSGTGATASCSVNYTQDSSGQAPITATYAGNDAHSASSTQVTLTISPNPTQTSVACTPDPVSTGQASSCTVTVTDTGATPITPTGTVSFDSNGSGTLTASSCTLSGSGASATCTVAYSQSAAGTAQIIASYQGDGGHDPSNGSATLTVNVTSGGSGGTGTSGGSGGTGGTSTSGGSSGTGGTSTSGGSGGTGGTSGTGAPADVIASGTGTITIGHIHTDGARATIPISCHGAAGQTCTVKLTITQAMKHGHANKRTIVAKRSITLDAGQKRSVQLTLDHTATKLLERLHRTSARLTATQATKTLLRTTVAFKRPAPRHAHLVIR